MAETKFKVACVQLEAGKDKKANVENAATQIDTACKAGAQLIVLPECFNSPYGTKYFDEYAEEVTTGESPTAIMLSTKAREHGVFIIGGSFPERDMGKLYNTCIAFNKEGDMVCKHRKMHLFDIDIPGQITFKESDTLSPGDTPTIFDLSEHGGPAARIGIGICYDIRFPELCSLYRNSGCNMLIFPGAFNMVTGPAHWELLARGRAVDNQCFLAFCSPARDDQADYTAWGHSLVFDPWGDKLGELDEKPGILYADVDLEQVVTRRTNMPYHFQKRSDVYSLESPFLPKNKDKK